jgi:hypothetical protein
MSKWKALNAWARHTAHVQDQNGRCTEMDKDVDVLEENVHGAEMIEAAASC